MTAAIFLLKGLRPEKYRERVDTRFEWDGDLAKLSDQQLATLMSQLAQVAGINEKACTIEVISEPAKQIEAADD